MLPFTIKVARSNPVEAAEAGESPSMGGFTLNVPTLTVPRGSVVAVVGHVGSGKSMLVEALLGGGPHVVQGVANVIHPLVPKARYQPCVYIYTPG